MSDWTEQALELWATYTDAQRELWNGWFEAGGRFGAGATAGSEAASDDGEAAPPWASNWDEWPDRWQDMARKTLSLWTVGTDRVPAEVIDRLFSGEEAFLQFLDLSLGALKVVAPKIDAGEDWADVLRRYLAQIRDSMLQGSPWITKESAGAFAGASPELWSLYTTELQRFMGPWAQAIQTAMLSSTDLAAGDRQAFAGAQAAFMDAFDGTFGRYASAPSVGSSRELNERLWRGFEAWVAVRRASTDFQNQMVNTGFHTYEDMLRELVEKGEREEKVTTLRELFDLWIDIGETGYADLFSTDDFAELQARLVNASMQYQMRAREIEEEFLTAMGQPTRTEIDQVHRHVYDLRVEVRYMKRDTAAMRRQIETLGATLAEAQQVAAQAAAQAASVAASVATSVAAAQAEARRAASMAEAQAKERQAASVAASVAAAQAKEQQAKAAQAAAQAASVAAAQAKAQQAKAQQAEAQAKTLAAAQAKERQAASVAAAQAKEQQAKAAQAKTQAKTLAAAQAKTLQAASVAAEPPPTPTAPEAKPVRMTEPSTTPASPAAAAKPAAVRAGARSTAAKPTAAKKTAPTTVTPKAASKRVSKAKPAAQDSEAKPAAQKSEPGVPGEGK